MSKLTIAVLIILFISTNSFGQLIVKDQETTPNTLLQVNDEGSAGSITLPAVLTSLSGYKLYNFGGNLFWGASQLNGGSGVSAINDLADAKYDGYSLFLGSGSGANDTGVHSNTAVGKDALNLNSTGYNNTVIGSNALKNNTLGNNNTGCGVSALRSNTTGSSNSVFGSNILYYNTTGNENTASGRNTLFNNLTGNGNTANGFEVTSFKHYRKL